MNFFNPIVGLSWDLDSINFPGTAATGLSFHIDTLKEFMKGQTVLLENLNCERALFWQCLVGYCVSLGTKGQSALDEILPEISEFCQYIER